MFNHNIKAMTQFLLLATMFVYSGMSDSSKDKEECTPQLAGLAECLVYVQGDANAPSPDCCSGIKDILKSNKKCLCLVIKDRNDPDLGGIQINVTLALNLPSVCNAPANISKCPELLHMDPKSKEAQIFYESIQGSTETGPSPAPSPSDGASSAGSQATSITQKNDAVCKEKRLFGLDVLAAGLLAWLLFGSNAGNIFIWIPM